MADQAKKQGEVVETGIAIGSALTGLFEASEEYYEKKKKGEATNRDLLELHGALLQSFYGIAKAAKMNGMLECSEEDKANSANLPGPTDTVTTAAKFITATGRCKGPDIVAAMQCTLDYAEAAMEWNDCREEVFRATGNDWGPTFFGHHFVISKATEKGTIETDMKAEKVMGAFYKELVDESLRRGMSPKDSCR